MTIRSSVSFLVFNSTIPCQVLIRMTERTRKYNYVQYKKSFRDPEFDTSGGLCACINLDIDPIEHLSTF